ncbi:membrane-tethered transcription factor [Lecanosticta acicola]|uniref:Membrane-tethered transcription factor n=1 Tax=Lecanosticta acicola TaxID=111012 RepID=A0AAI8Z446_9PEZI|nr:membrane-tethered transcription factor [Lecanosticta acicola]
MSRMSNGEIGHDSIEPFALHADSEVMWSENLLENDIDLWPVDGFVIDDSCWPSENEFVQQATAIPLTPPSSVLHDDGTQNELSLEFSETPKDVVRRSTRQRRNTSKPAPERIEKRKQPREVERKYRHKLRDHLSELKRTVPTLRAAAPGVKAGLELPGLPVAANSRKPTVLAKTLEYIRYLENVNRELLAQVEQCGCGQRPCMVM